MFEVGDVLYVYNTAVTPPEHKYSVFVCLNPNLFLLINTKNRKIYNCIPVKQEHNPYLKYDSFISCNRTFQYTLDQLKETNKVGRLFRRLCVSFLFAGYFQNGNNHPATEYSSATQLFGISEQLKAESR